MSAGAARGLRPFEPEHAAPDDAARARAARFADRELDVLAEQGNFERARVLLGRRVAAGGAEADVYLDAIRLERSAAPAGAAWQAWASRAFTAGIEIAGALAALVPERELCAYLIGQDVGWALLDRQRDRAAARALLRMRLEQQLRDDPIAALATIDDHALRAAAAGDVALRALVLGVITGAMWDARDRALAVAHAYGLGAGATASTQDAGETHARELLADAAQLQAAWIAAARSPSTADAQAPYPGALARFVRSGPVASRAVLASLARELLHDLRARPRAYLDCADVFARHAAELGAWLIAECDAARDMLAAPRNAGSDADAAERALAPARGNLRSGGLARLAPWPLRRTLDRRLYAGAIRPVLLEAIVQHGASLPALCNALRALATGRGGALAALAEHDRGLAIASALAAFAHAGGG